MLTALAAFHSDSDLQTVLQLLRTGDVNAKASQVRPLLLIRLYCPSTCSPTPVRRSHTENEHSLMCVMICHQTKELTFEVRFNILCVCRLVRRR